jgi:hypothetical protein
MSSSLFGEFTEHMRVLDEWFATGNGQAAIRLMNAYSDFEDTWESPGLMKWTAPGFNPDDYEEISIEEFAGVDDLTELGRTGFLDIDEKVHGIWEEGSDVLKKPEAKPLDFQSSVTKIVEHGLEKIQRFPVSGTASEVLEQYEGVLRDAFSSVVPAELSKIKVGFSEVTQWLDKRLKCDLTRGDLGKSDNPDLEQLRMLFGHFGSDYEKVVNGHFDRKSLKEIFERVSIIPEVDQGAVFDGGTSQGLAFCIPPSEGKTVLANRNPSLFDDCDAVFHRALQINPGFMVGVEGSQFERMYRKAAYLVRDRGKVLLTQSPKCVPSGMKFYSFLLCCCDGVHPHVEHGVRKFSMNPLHAYHRDRAVGSGFNVVYFSSYEQRNSAVLLLTEIHQHEQRMREFVFNKFHDQLNQFN